MKPSNSWIYLGKDRPDGKKVASSMRERALKKRKAKEALRKAGRKGKDDGRKDSREEVLEQVNGLRWVISRGDA